ncbi:MAG TPA: c-type cytochrome, partial [Longimicrobiaceae bacterium]|nr:c-type cytochrome [Longimicrobiaceae bacterium]
NCAVCHGTGAVSGGALPDLRRMSEETIANFHEIVLRGSRAGRGRPAFGVRMTAEQADAILAYIRTRPQ